MSGKLRTTGQQNIITHVGILGDATPSVSGIKPQVVETINNLVKLVAQDSQERGQEVRVTLYTFNSWEDPTCKYYDMDALRVPEITVRDYALNHMTALRDATAFVIDEMQDNTWQKYGDHSFLLYVVTDGADNQSTTMSPEALRVKLTGLPDNWTVGVQVPDAVGARRAQQCGFADGNIDIWETTAQGAVEAGERLKKSYVAYASARTAGTRSTNSLFKVNAVTPDQVKKNLTPVTKGSYFFLDVPADIRVDNFLKDQTGKFEIGQAYYQLTKAETVQGNKRVALETPDGVLYSGTEARHMLGLPDYEMRVRPSQQANTVFIQSTSMNRKLIGGTRVLVFR